MRHFTHPVYTIIPITAQTCEQVMEVFDSNREFFMLTEGEPATLASCRASASAVPPGFDVANKHFISFWEGKKCVAVLDFLAGYPGPDSLYLGLLLVHGDLHGAGVGQSIVNALLAAAKKDDFAQVQLAVIESNAKAIAFWEKLGFVQTGTSTAAMPGGMVNVITMALEI